MRRVSVVVRHSLILDVLRNLAAPIPPLVKRASTPASLYHFCHIYSHTTVVALDQHPSIPLLYFFSLTQTTVVRVIEADRNLHFIGETHHVTTSLLVDTGPVANFTLCNRHTSLSFTHDRRSFLKW